MYGRFIYGEIMKILLAIALTALVCAPSYGAFKGGTGGANNANQSNNGYRIDGRSGGYNIKNGQTDSNDIDAIFDAVPSEINNATKAVMPPTPTTVTSESNSDAGKKIQKVTKNGVVSYTWASSSQLAQNETEAEVEILTISSFGREDSSTASICKVKNMGVNIEGINYYSQGMPFIDIAKMSMGWIRSWGSSWENVELDLDNNGYLKTVDAGTAQTIISDDLWGRDISDNRYVLLYDGEGKLEFNLNKAKVIKSEPGRIELELPQGRAGMAQKSTNPSNYLRNIRIIPIEHENDYKQAILHEQYKKTWENIGVVRYLNTQATNHSTEIQWQDRQKPTKFGTKGGQSIEDIIQMSNEMNVNPWLLAPHLANDDYFREMAIYVRDNLNSNLKVYIEYTNEAWNWQFPQTKYLAALAKKNGTTQYQEYGKRAKRLFDIWLDVFGSETRIIRVIGTQFGNPWISEQIMKTTGLDGSVDALAVGYYIGHELGSKKMASKTLAMSNAEIFTYLRDNSFPEAKKLLQEQKIVADNYGLELVAYEAGQHLVASGVSPDLGVLVDHPALTEKLISLNRDGRMTDFYMDMYKQWSEIGGGLIVWFATTDKPTKWGSWGLLESMGQDPEKAPKYQAIRNMFTEQGC